MKITGILVFINVFILPCAGMRIGKTSLSIIASISYENRVAPEMSVQFYPSFTFLKNVCYGVRVWLNHLRMSLQINNLIDIQVNTCRVYFFSVMLLSFFNANVCAKDAFKMIGDESHVSQHWKELLTASLDITSQEFGLYDVVIYDGLMGNDRHMQEMIKGELINTAVGITTFKREAAYIPIRIPILKGLLSYRLMLVNKSVLNKFGSTMTLKKLKQFRVGLLDKWVTSKILQQHTFNIMLMEDESSLFRMLAANRYDYTVRGVNEIFTDLDVHIPNDTDLAIVSNIGLYIKSPNYFFISKRHPKLAKRLEKGLELILKNGQFDQIFYKWHQKSIDEANLKQRTFINIDNPLLPSGTPVDRPELWFRTQPN